MPRTVYGNTHSRNGWPMVNADECEWVKVPGTNDSVSLQIQKGAPAIILRAFVADWNAYLEPVYDADSACWTPTNSVPTSDHLSGTACDVRWNSHPFRVSYAGFNQQMIATMREMLDFYEGVVFWGQDWSSPKDPMHVSLNGSAYGGPDTFNNPHTQDFINRKIRADGFSTYRRGAPITPPPPPAHAEGLNADRLAQAMGNAVPIERYRALLPAVRAALVQSGCAGNLNRTAMWLAQIGHESGGLKWMEEIASGAAYEGRVDLGNIQPGDGVRFKGHGPIQITGRHNHTKVSEWAYSKGFVPTPTYFVDNPQELASDRYGMLGAVWYWTVARPNINAMCDAGDLEGVTRAINGGLNGLEDRLIRWERCRAMGLAALDVTGEPPPPTPQEGFLMALSDSQQHELYEAVCGRRPSLSALRPPGDTRTYTMRDMVDLADGSVHFLAAALAAKLGHPDTLALLEQDAAGLGQYPDRRGDALLATAILADFAAPAADESSFSAAPVSPPVDSRQLADAYAENARLREENARLREENARLQQPVSQELLPVVNGARTSGDRVAQLIDSVEDWTELALSMDVKQRAALAASIKVLQIQQQTGDKQ